MPTRRLFAFFVTACAGALVGGLYVHRLKPSAANGPATPDATPTESREVVLAKRVAGLEAEVALLDRKLKAAEESATRPTTSFTPPASDEADAAARAALAGIVLPPNPTRDDVVRYVRRIMRVAGSQNHFASTDPHIDMLARVGPEHLDVLLAEGDDRFYMPRVVAKVAREDQKAQVIAALKRHPDLVSAVRERHWDGDAKQVLVDRLRQSPTDISYLNLPPEWIQAVADFRDPETYPLLRRYLASGSNPWWTYQAVSGLDIDLDEWVAHAWMRRRAEVRGLGAFVGLGDRWSDFEKVAVQHGHAEALDRLFNALRDARADRWRRESAREAVTAVTEATGSDAELVAW
ncbi:MAG TPA: hypothetical protein VF796_17985, partial [Humisphaera sp.]